MVRMFCASVAMTDACRLTLLHAQTWLRAPSAAITYYITSFCGREHISSYPGATIFSSINCIIIECLVQPTPNAMWSVLLRGPLADLVLSCVCKWPSKLLWNWFRASALQTSSTEIVSIQLTYRAVSWNMFGTNFPRWLLVSACNSGVLPCVVSPTRKHAMAAHEQRMRQRHRWSLEQTNDSNILEACHAERQYTSSMNTR